MRAAPNSERILFFVAVALPLFAIWGVVFPPLLDFPEHVLMVHVLAKGSYDAGPEYQGRLEWHALWAPYSLAYLLALPLARLVSAAVAVKMLLSMAVLATAFALRWLLSVLQRDRFAFYFGFPFLFSVFYLVGSLPYALGVPLLIAHLTLLLKQPVTTRRNFPLRLAFSMALPWTHPLIYVAGAAALAAAALAMHWRSVRQLLLAALWIGLPALYLAAWTPSLSANQDVRWEHKTLHVRMFLSNLGAYDTPAPDRYFLLPKVPFLLWLVFAVVIWKRREKWSREQKALAASVGALLLVAAAVPEFYSSQVIGANLRFTPIAAALSCGLLGFHVTRPLLPRALLAMWCVGALTAHAVLAWRFDHQMDGFVTLARLMEPRQVMTEVYEGPQNMLYAHALSYQLAAKGGICPETFLSLQHIRHMPVRLLPPFPWGDVDWGSNDPLTHPAGRAFRYVLVRTSRNPADPLPNPPHHRLVARSGGWVLYERR